jgi:hypothetical protein
VVGHGKQAIGIGRQVDAHHAGALVGDYIEKTRILMGETVMVLSPDQRGDQQVE